MLRKMRIGRRYGILKNIGTYVIMMQSIVVVFDIHIERRTGVNIDKVAILIKKAALVIDKLSNPVLAPYELTHTQYKILMLLFRHQEQPLRQIDIETHFAMSNPTVTGIIQNLEKKGLVRRIPNPDDKRSKLLQVTEQVLSMRDELVALGDSMEQQVTSPLSAEERQQLTRLLRKILHE